MEKTQGLERFFKGDLMDKHAIVTDNNNQFNVFERNSFTGSVDLPYSRKDFYKISLVKGRFKFHYADQYIESGESTLLFVNPDIPFSWELNGEQSGYCCVFTADFLSNFEYVRDYPLFKAGDAPAFCLSEAEVATLTGIYLKMLKEFNSNFVYKFDVLRTLVLELIYGALKMQPIQRMLYKDSNASQRIVNYFMELLERQFPIEAGQRLSNRFPVDFAHQLSVHVNHLNRSLKEVTGNTTTQVIALRVLKEARILLLHTSWSISAIAWCLGFEELPHFINFFKKRTKLSPRAFRKQWAGALVTTDYPSQSNDKK